MIDDIPDEPDEPKEDFTEIDYDLFDFKLSPDDAAPVHHLVAIEAGELETFLKFGSGLMAEYGALIARCDFEEGNIIVAFYTPPIDADSSLEILHFECLGDDISLQIACLANFDRNPDDEPEKTQRLVLVKTNALPPDGIFLNLHVANSRPGGSEQVYDEADAIVEIPEIKLPQPLLKPARPVPLPAKLSAWKELNPKPSC